MAAKKMPAKKAVATRRSADATAGSKTAGLARLKTGLSGRGSGSADAQAGRGALKTKNFMNDVYNARGGGRGSGIRYVITSTAKRKPKVRPAPPKK